MQRRRFMRKLAIAAFITAFPWSTILAGNRIIGAEAPNGGAYLVKHFSVPRGVVVAGIEFTNNDASTVFPKVILLRGPLERISEGTVLAQVTNVRATLDPRVRIALAPIQSDSQDLYVAIALPPSSGIQAVSSGAGIGAVQLQAPTNSYFADGENDYLGAMDVEYELELLYQTVGKATFEGESSPPRTFLNSGRPNPATSVARIEFGLDRPMRAKLGIYNVAGRLVRLLADGSMDAGVHTVGWDGKDDRGLNVAAGVYVAKLQTEGKVLTQKMVIAK